MRKQSVKLAALAYLLMGLIGFQALGAPVAGEAAPPFVALSLEGKRFDLRQMQGKVTLVHFWATWCPDCLVEMPVLDGFYQRYHDHGIEVIGVTVERPRARGKVLEAMKNLHFPAFFLSEAEENGFGTPASLPVTYVIGPKGQVAAVLSPDKEALSKALLERISLPLLKD
jgi:thiol-disulfide isomerase/thioredoxin